MVIIMYVRITLTTIVTVSGQRFISPVNVISGNCSTDVACDIIIFCTVEEGTGADVRRYVLITPFSLSFYIPYRTNPAIQFDGRWHAHFVSTLIHFMSGGKSLSAPDIQLYNFHLLKKFKAKHVLHLNNEVHEATFRRSTYISPEL